MKKVKITILKTSLQEDLAKEYGVECPETDKVSFCASYYACSCTAVIGALLAEHCNECEYAQNNNANENTKGYVMSVERNTKQGYRQNEYRRDNLLCISSLLLSFLGVDDTCCECTEKQY